MIDCESGDEKKAKLPASKVAEIRKSKRDRDEMNASLTEVTDPLCHFACILAHCHKEVGVVSVL